MGQDRTSGNVRALLADGEDLVRSARTVLEGPTALRGRARSELRAATAEEVSSRLRDAPIESLKDTAGPGTRFGALRNAGVTSVQDVLERGRSVLAQVHGVGPSTADAITRAADAMRTAVADDVRFRLDADGESPAHTALLATLAAVRAADTAARDLGRRLSGPADEIERLVNAGRPARSWWRARLLTRPSRRHAAYEALDELGELLDTPTTRALRAEIDDVLTAIDPGSRRRRELWDTYRRDAASINALLSTLEPSPVDVGGAAHGFVTQEIDEAAERTELDLRRLRPDTVLRNYQAFGARYLFSRRRAILGDEMGLGKTLQALAVIAHLATERGARFLVVCPAAVLVNWLHEIDKHVTVPAHVLHGADRDAAGRAWSRDGGVAVTTFHTLGRLAEDVRSTPVSLVVVDEAHHVKNPATATARSVQAVLTDAPRAILLTGTPMENRVEEFRTLVAYLNPAVARRVGAHDALAGARAFRRAVAEVYLRRNQDDVLVELPERIETESWVHPTADDAAAYRDAVRAGALTTMRRAAWVAPGSAKMERLRQLIDEAEDDEAKVLVFSEFLHTLDRVAQEVPGVVGRITGSVPPAERQRLVTEFSQRPGHAVLAAQIVAGGVGLNIQAASVVVLAEPHWKPGVEEQAIARAHRMGQTRPVQVHRLLAKGTVDERVREVQQGKRELFDAYARRSDAKDADSGAVDTGDRRLERRLVAVERDRLGLD